jgi:hypothetical protein
MDSTPSTPNNNNTVAQPPPTPTVNRARPRESGGTPPRQAPALRRTITNDSLPSDFRMPTINMRETNAQMATLTGRDLPTGVLPDEAKVVYHKVYSGRKTHLGSVAILLALDMRKAVVCMCLHTQPQQIGKEVMNVLNAKAERDGGAAAPKDRWPGITWIGIDETNLCKKTPYLTKMGWFATPDSTKGAMALQKLIKQISCEVLSSNMPMDFYLAEMNVPDQAVEKTKVILDILSRKITIDVSVEDDNEATQREDTA